MLVATARMSTCCSRSPAPSRRRSRRSLAAIEHGKHVALMNPELDGTLGPLLKAKADKAGVVFTDVDGDQPGVS